MRRAPADFSNGDGLGQGPTFEDLANDQEQRNKVDAWYYQSLRHYLEEFRAHNDYGSRTKFTDEVDVVEWLQLQQGRLDDSRREGDDLVSVVFLIIDDAQRMAAIIEHWVQLRLLRLQSLRWARPLIFSPSTRSSAKEEGYFANILNMTVSKLQEAASDADWLRRMEEQLAVYWQEKKANGDDMEEQDDIEMHDT